MGVLMKIDRKEYLELKRLNTILIAENEQLKKENEALKNKLTNDKKTTAKTETKKEA